MHNFTIGDEVVIPELNPDGCNYSGHFKTDVIYKIKHIYHPDAYTDLILQLDNDYNIFAKHCVPGHDDYKHINQIKTFIEEQNCLDDDKAYDDLCNYINQLKGA